MFNKVTLGYPAGNPLKAGAPAFLPGMHYHDRLELTWPNTLTWGAELITLPDFWQHTSANTPGSLGALLAALCAGPPRCPGKSKPGGVG
eukprot:1159364-Pelagomonas_calceolata.AAC.5